MPLPNPTEGENQQQFITRCIQSEAGSNQQALAICHSLWDNERTMDPNEKLLTAIKSRTQKLTEFNFGIGLADQYVKTLEECVGTEICKRYAVSKESNWGQTLLAATNTLVYSNEDMVTEKKLGSKILTSLTGWKEVIGLEDPDIELPRNTLVLFTHILTTPRKDRDGDRLRSEGAILDPKMLLLWQHVPTLPIGKMLVMLEQSEQLIRNASVIIDMNELCHDAAVMIDNDMARFSHGFRALVFEALKEEGTDESGDDLSGPNGFDIKKFEIMEESLVSVPSNTDAEVEEVILSLVESGKLTSPFMKAYGKTVRERRPTQSSISYHQKVGDWEEKIEANNTAEFEAIYKVVNVNKENKNENESRSGSLEDKNGKGQGCQCPSKETDEDTGKKKGSSDNKEIETDKKRYQLQGSWEEIERQLRGQAKSFLESARIPIRDRFIWLAGTFSDHVVICAEHYESGVIDEFLYYKVSWEDGDDGASLIGEVQAVDIITTTEIIERSPLYPQKSGDETETSRSRSVDQAIGEIISNANREERAKLKSYLGVLDDSEASFKVGSQYRQLI